MFDEGEDDQHPCEMGECKRIVAFDDEPYCYEHSPDSGSHMIGYSYKRAHRIDVDA